MFQLISLAIILFSANLLLILGDPLDNGILPTQNLITPLVQALEKGVTINLPGTAIKVGLVTVPFDTLCKISLTEPITCRICVLDCRISHKASSGKCGPHPIRLGETICLCDYSPATEISTVTSICGSELIDQEIDIVIAQVLYGRLKTILCSRTLMGCETDCINNHGAKTGVCEGGYCICYY